MVNEMVTKKTDSQPSLLPSHQSLTNQALKKALILHLGVLMILMGSFATKGAALRFPSKPVRPIEVVYLPPKRQAAAQSAASSPVATSPKQRVKKNTSTKSSEPSKQQDSQRELQKKQTLKSMQQQLQDQMAHLLETPDQAPAKKEHHCKGAWISAILQSWLQLPEYGEVELLIELSLEGNITKLEVLRSESEKNASYLVDQLAHSQLPLIFEKDEPKTFILTLGHAEF